MFRMSQKFLYYKILKEKFLIKHFGEKQSNEDKMIQFIYQRRISKSLFERTVQRSKNLIYTETLSRNQRLLYDEVEHNLTRRAERSFVRFELSWSRQDFRLQNQKQILRALYIYSYYFVYIPTLRYYSITINIMERCILRNLLGKFVCFYFPCTFLQFKLGIVI